MQHTTPQSIQSTLETELVAQSVNALIQQARKKRGLTLEQIGKALHVGKSRVSQLEKEGTNLELTTLVRVAKALKYDVRVSFVPIKNE